MVAGGWGLFWGGLRDAWALWSVCLALCGFCRCLQLHAAACMVVASVPRSWMGSGGWGFVWGV